MPSLGKRNHSKLEQNEQDPAAPVETGSCNAPRYDAVFETMSQAQALWRLACDDSGRPYDLEICAANKAFRELFGLPDMVGHLAGEIDPHYHDKDPDILGITSRVAETGVPENHEVYHPSLEKWLEFRAETAPDGLLLTSAEDISERKAAEAALDRMRYSLDHIDDYPAWSDESGRIVEVSEAACRHLEYTRDELLSMTVFDLHPDLDADRWRESWREDRPQAPFRLEVEYRTKSGRRVPMELSINPMVFDGKRLHCAICRDISDRARTDEKLRRLQYSLDQLDDYPTWNDSDGRIIEVSESTCRHLEYTQEELLNMTVFDICPDLERDREAWRRSWREAIPATSFRVETRHRTKSGRVFPVEVTVCPMVFQGQQYHCTFCRDISDRKALEESLLLTQLSVENAPDMIHWLDSEGRITYANRSTCEFLGYSLEELQATPIWEVNPGLTPETLKQRWAKTANAGILMIEETWMTKDGRKLDVELTATAVLHGDEELSLVFVRDVTDRRLAENSLKESEERYRQLFEAQSETLKSLKERDEQLLQSQKMEAIGRLAGGIAHDFNNVLTTIIGYSDLILSSAECPAGSVAEDVGEIKDAAERAAALTQRILAFSRRQAMQPTLVSLNDVVSETRKMLARTIGADIELVTSLSPDLGKVEVDEQQFVQVLLNLAVNARDAMPKGGKLTLSTTEAVLDDQFCETHPEVTPGRCVVLTVADTGSGIDKEVLSHVFEPFYTTKPPGLGTGLGLATVYGIVAQSEGCIYVHSEPGHGTTFTIYLPRAEEAPGPPDTQTLSHPGTNTVMVVDSDAAFLTLTKRILERRGFQVLPATNGEQAAKMLADRRVKIDGLITDLSLSGTLQGEQLAALATRGRPGLRLLLVSKEAGTAQAAAERRDLQAGYLEKPFTAQELNHEVRTWLRQSDSAGGQPERTEP